MASRKSASKAARAVSVGVALLALFGIVGAEHGIACAQEPSSGGSAQELPGRARLHATSSNEEQPFEAIYDRFYATYKLGPDDHIAIHLVGQPDYSLEDVKISPVGRIYHPLLGEIAVAGMTVPEVTDKLTTEFREYIKAPSVSVSLLEAKSAKVGVIGEVVNPGIVVMTRPMTILEAISESGGFTEFGSKSSVVLLRQGPDGQFHPTEIDLKRVLAGKATPAENVALVAGDTIVVKSNGRKKWLNIMSATGLGSFTTFVRYGNK